MAPVRYHEGDFPPAKLHWERLIPLLGPASAALARYDGVLGTVPNAKVLLSPLTVNEAVLSSKIEGTVTTMGEVLEYEAGAGPDEKTQPSKVGDIQEVLNYRWAITRAEKRLQDLPLSGRLIKEAHRVLMQGVRGQSKTPGEYRTAQNWIGPHGCSEAEARFVSIPPIQLLDGITRWENYLHSDQPDALVQLAIVHAEFESLHPFQDGNGRLGRMLIPLFLFTRNLLSGPTFYMSEYLEAKRDEYYERLLAVSRDGNWTGWCEFFLRAMIAQADANTRKAKAILDLYEQKKSWVVDKTHSQHAIRALDYIFANPIFRSAEFVKQSDIPKPTAQRIIRVLKDAGLFMTVRGSSGRRSSVLAFRELLNVAEGKEAF